MSLNENLAAAAVKAKQQVLIENWAQRIGAVEKAQEAPMTFEQKGTLAQVLENTNLAMRMAESTDAGATDGIKRFTMDLITSVVPNLVAQQLVSVQPIDNQVGVVNYIKYIYGNNKGAVKAGSTFADALQNNNTDMYYSSEEVSQEQVEHTGASFKGNLSWLPALPGTFQIGGAAKVGDNSVAFKILDDNAGNVKVVDAFTGKAIDGVTATGSLDYDSGAYDITLTGATIEDTDTFTADYHYDQKSIGSGAMGSNVLQVPEVNVKIESIPVIAQSRKLKALYAFDSMFVLQKEYGTDINAILNTQIAAEIAHEIDGEIMNDLLRGAGLQNEGWSSYVPVGVSKPDHYESFLNTLVVGSNKIFGATKRATGNFLVVGLNVSSVIETARQFKPGNVPAGVVGPHIIGQIGGFTVVKNPYYPADSYVIGYKGTSLFEAGYIYAPYMPIISTSLVMADDFVGRKGWSTSYGKKFVNSMLYCRGEITSAKPTAI